MANSLLLGGLTVIGIQYLIDPAVFFKFNKLEIVVTLFSYSNFSCYTFV
jgi:hypothetical protein